MSEVYRILYCSRNTIEGSAEAQQAEVADILAKSRANNASRGITGALLFNSGCFAQVLEGPLEAVERTFERIQLDLRHDEVAVLECGTVPARDFPEWSMAFAGVASAGSRFAEMSLAEMLENQTTAAAEISEMLRTLVVQEDELELA